jgi:NO-binding membrane sensor protein with MHYT domain
VNPAKAGRWLVLGALAIGGTGIWVMHFIAMLGFSVPEREIRYNMPMTALSALLAVTVVGVGLFVAQRGGRRVMPLTVGGLIMGIGVATMHYTGMAAMNMHAGVGYDRLLFALSVVIAVVASVVALWFTLSLRRWWTILLGTLTAGLAVCGMHFTGMAAMRVDLGRTAGASGGALAGTEANDLLLPLVLGISLLTVVLLFIVALSPDVQEMEEIARHEEYMDRARQERDEIYRTVSGFGGAGGSGSGSGLGSGAGSGAASGVPGSRPAGGAGAPGGPASTRRDGFENLGPDPAPARPRIDPDTGRATRSGRPNRRR